MKNVDLVEMSTLSVGELVDTLSDTYTLFFKKNMPLKDFPSVMLWSPPGVGKSEAIREIAENLQSSTGRNVVVTDVRLLLFNAIDLRGIPVANADKTLAVWLKPKIFQMDPSDKTINILFLDEISAAPQSVQAAAYQITLDRVIGEHKLPDNCIVIAAGNRLSDKSVAYKMPKALANRLMHFQLEVSFKSWKEYAISKGVNEKVLGFLSFKPDYLSTFDSSGDALAFATPRSWMMVSNILNEVNENIEKVYPYICGLVSTGVATEFRAWNKVFKSLPTYKEIYEGKKTIVPPTIDGIYALVSSLTMHAKEYLKNDAALSNLARYGQRLPADFSIMMLVNLFSTSKDAKAILLKNEEFQKWVHQRGSSLNGII